MACDYSSAKEALRLGTSSATAGAQGLHDICPCLIRGLAEGRVSRVNDNECQQLLLVTTAGES